MKFNGIKIRVKTKNQTQWNNAVTKAFNEGAFSRDGDFEFNPDKPYMVIDNGAVKSSNPDFTPTKAPYDTEMSYSKFMNSGTKFSDADFDCCESECIDLTISVTKNFGYLLPVEVDTIPQNPIIFKTAGIPFLLAHGVDFTELEGKYYVVDTADNTANELTADWVINKGVEDMMDGEVTVFTAYLDEFQLVTNMVLAKKAPEAVEA